MTNASSPDASVRFDGRILFLAEDPQIVQRQLEGNDVTLADAGPLRSDVSTDEITPAWICYHYDEKLGEYPYLGLKCGDALPVATHLFAADSPYLDSDAVFGVRDSLVIPFERHARGTAPDGRTLDRPFHT